jgi:uncharacterized membrane protein (DUF441 family)
MFSFDVFIAIQRSDTNTVLPILESTGLDWNLIVVQIFKNDQIDCNTA